MLSRFFGSAMWSRLSMASAFLGSLAFWVSLWSSKMSQAFYFTSSIPFLVKLDIWIKYAFETLASASIFYFSTALNSL